MQGTVERCRVMLLQRLRNAGQLWWWGKSRRWPKPLRGQAIIWLEDSSLQCKTTPGSVAYRETKTSGGAKRKLRGAMWEEERSRWAWSAISSCMGDGGARVVSEQPRRDEELFWRRKGVRLTDGSSEVASTIERRFYPATAAAAADRLRPWQITLCHIQKRLWSAPDTV